MSPLPDPEVIITEEKKLTLTKSVVMAFGIFFFATALFIGIVIAVVKFASRG